MRADRWKHVLVFGCLAILAAGALAPGGDEPRTAARDARSTRGHSFDVVRSRWGPGSSIDAPIGQPGPAVAVVAAGDLSCDPTNEMFNAGHGTRRWCRAEDTEALIQRIDPDVVIPLGDTQYDEGRLAAFRASYALHWGLERWRSRPVVGNHEYLSSPDAHGYFTYFGPDAGPPGKGWYSYDAGAWHIVALNSNCMLVRCDRSSGQYRWLADDLAASPAPCTLVTFHHARFSSGPHGDEPELLLLRPIWRLLYQRGVDLVLNAHDHIYERFAPMDPAGTGIPRSASANSSSARVARSITGSNGCATRARCGTWTRSACCGSRSPTAAMRGRSSRSMGSLRRPGFRHVPRRSRGEAVTPRETRRETRRPPYPGRRSAPSDRAASSRPRRTNRSIDAVQGLPSDRSSVPAVRSRAIVAIVT